MLIKIYIKRDTTCDPYYLIHKAEIDFFDLPDELKEIFKGVSPKDDEIDLNNLKSRWWLNEQVIKSLELKGYYKICWTTD